MPSIARRRSHGIHVGSRLSLVRSPTTPSARTAQASWRSPARIRSRLPEGHRVRFTDRHALAVRTSRTWLWIGRDLLATLARLDPSRSLAAHPRKALGSTGACRWHRCLAGGHGQCQRPRRFGGAHTGPNPTDRAKNGCKRHILTDARGVPLKVIITPANVHDSKMALPLIDQMPRIAGPLGRPRKKPDVVLGDRAYGTPNNLAGCKARGILPLLARIGTDHGSGLGTMRWVVESCLAWFGHHRRLKICYEKDGRYFQAFHELAAALICAGKLNGKIRF